MKIQLLLIGVLLAWVGITAAQPPDDWERYTTENDLITLDTPADWVVEENIGAVMVATNQATIDNLGETPEPGQLVFNLMLLPIDFLDTINIPDDDLQAMAQALVGFFVSVEDGEPALDFMDVDPPDDLPDTVALQVFEADAAQGAVWVRVLDDEILVIGFAAGYPGEVVEQQAVLRDILLSLTFAGEVEDLLGVAAQ